MDSRAARRSSLRTGDVARVIRECLGEVRGAVAMVTATAPGGEWTRAEIAEWNRGESKAWRRFNGRIRSEMRKRHGASPPVLLAWVAQRQGRGLDHLHLVFWCLTRDHELRIRQWVAIYRELQGQYGFGDVDDPFKLRRSKRTRKVQNMIVQNSGNAGGYLGNYLAGGQLERFVEAEDRSWRPYWISPELMRRSGWSLKKCGWIRQAYFVGRGEWVADQSPFGRLSTRLPSWWFDDGALAWVMAQTGWDGVPGSRAGPLSAAA